ncbi:MAG: hypothetical protein M3O15_12060, partial [Acidobacteriota bacterium]|nr:hypothetical protein [Acidobacteriota bacterium]
HLDYSPDEEGFQWYGALAVARGEVPLRDFYSYDPGRYYWGALWVPLLGGGLLTLRLGTAVFGAAGLFCGLAAARRVTPSRWLLALLGALLLLWMLPRNKLFEPAVAMAAVWAAVALIERPSLSRHFACGALTGFGAWMGKNHGAYLFAAFLPLILFIHLRLEPPDEGGALRLGRKLAAWGGGMAAGAAPLLLMLAAVSGFWRSYVDSILFFLEQGRTNFPLPIPWPWRIRWGGPPLYEAQALALGCCFLLPAVLALGGGLLALGTTPANRDRRKLLLAALAVGLVYSHHAFSRADLAHLGSSIQPLLLATVALPAVLGEGRRKRMAMALAVLFLVASTALVAVPANLLFQQLTIGRFVFAHQVAGEEIRLRAPVADLLDWVEEVVPAKVPAGEAIFLAPNMPGLYPVLGRRSPVWDIYPIWPAAGKLDARMLAELERGDVRWALVQNASVDGRDEFRFRNTHPLVWDYLMEHFEMTDAWKPRHPFRCMLLHRR